MRTIFGVTFYPLRSGMHGAIEFHARRWGYVVIQPPVSVFGHRWPWYVFVSPNATPWAATWGAGPGLSASEKREVRERRQRWGHNYSTEQHDPQAIGAPGYSASIPDA